MTTAGFKQLGSLRLANAWRRVPVFWRFQLAGWAAFIIFSFPLKWVVFEDIRGSVLVSLYRDGLGFLLTIGMREIYRRIDRRHPQLHWIAVWVIVVSLIGGAILTTLSLLFHSAFDFQEDKIFTNSVMFGVFYFRTGLCLCWSVLYFGIKQMRESAQRDVRLAKAETDRQRAELHLLRMQMNPHFILNALNAMRAELSRPGQQLKNLVQALADYLRYSLDNRDHDEVPVGNEFDAIKSYLAVEKARFRDELEIECRMDETAREELVPGVFMLGLVDNAIKYGRKTSPLPLRVRLVVSQPAPHILRVEVANTGQWVEEARPRPFGGLGLKNLRHRLALLYPGKDCLHILKEPGLITVQVDIPAKA
ncbi:histidine kinase [soil metagenome]